MPTVEHSICILRSHFVSEVHRMQIPPHTTHSPLYRLPVHNDNNNKGATKVHDKSYGIVSPQLPIWKDKKILSLYQRPTLRPRKICTILR